MNRRHHRLELALPPGIVALVAFLLMEAGRRAFPSWTLSFPGSGWIAAGLAVLGGGVASAGVVAFRRAKTTVNPLKPESATSLVVGGVYRFTRNPMYLGLTLILSAWALYGSNLASVPILAAFVAYLDRFQIQPEERRLAKIFGARFEAYRERVRRWV